jgi:capsular polysaccharide biosynthesis protein
MSEQALDLRRFVRSVQRHKGLVGIAAAVGLLAGAGLALIVPPALTSKALVVLPRSAPNIATQVVIAGSDPVLSRALPKLGPGTSLQALRRDIQVKSPTTYLISINATGSNAAQAEAAANAVAASYIAYVESPSSPMGAIPASMFESATTATGPSTAERLIVYLLLGAVAGALVGAIAALVISRADQRLRGRDEIANSIGLPVLASLPVGHPADAAGWTKLLDNYQPGAVHAWRLRTALKELGIVGPNASNGSNASNGTSASLAVLSLASDPGAFALGPQLAVFAASLGIPTALVIGPQQDTTATATLRTACAVAPLPSSKRSGNLQVAVADDSNGNGKSDAALTVVVTVVDDENPSVADTLRATTTVLGVSAGAATAEQLARTAVSAAADGREVAGILLADPDPTDRTTGRVPPLGRPAQPRPPNTRKA